MKHILLIAAAVLLLCSCKKEKASPDPGTTNDNTKALLIGKWAFTADTVKQFKNGAVTSSITNSILLNNPATSYDQFNADGTGSEAFGGSGGVASFTYSVSGQILTFNYPDQVSNDLPIPAHVDKATIKTITANSLKIFFDDSWTDDKGNLIRVTEAQYLAK